MSLPKLLFISAIVFSVTNSICLAQGYGRPAFGQGGGGDSGEDLNQGGSNYGRPRPEISGTGSSSYGRPRVEISDTGSNYGRPGRYETSGSSYGRKPEVPPTNSYSHGSGGTYTGVKTSSTYKASDNDGLSRGGPPPPSQADPIPSSPAQVDPAPAVAPQSDHVHSSPAQVDPAPAIAPQAEPASPALDQPQNQPPASAQSPARDEGIDTTGARTFGNKQNTGGSEPSAGGPPVGVGLPPTSTLDPNSSRLAPEPPHTK